jgi:hypothetical protein
MKEKWTIRRRETMKTDKPILLILLWICVPATLLLAIAMMVSKLVVNPLEFEGKAPIGYLWTFISCPISIAVGLILARLIPNNIVAPALILWGVSSSVWIQPVSIVSSVGPLLLIFIMGIGLPAGIILFTWFPDGIASPRNWEGIYTFYFVFNALVCIIFIFSNATFDTVVVTSLQPHNFYQPMLAPFANISSALVNGFIIPSWLFIPVAMFLRYRQASSLVRLQIKWMVWLVAIATLTFVPIIFYEPLFKRYDPFGILAPFGIVRYALYTYFQLLPAFAIAFAILRHRLYDIDIIIRRTVIYSILTTILAIVYFGGIVLLQRIFQNITGQNSELAIVASTLLIVAMFTPLRRRVQDTIDRRFYRRKYNAEQTIAKFNETLRDEVDLETLKANLVNVVQDTLEPSSIRIWIKEPSEK